MWIRRHEPEIYENTYKVLNAKDYIVFRLTGNFYTDYSDANSWLTIRICGSKTGSFVVVVTHAEVPRQQYVFPSATEPVPTFAVTPSPAPNTI